MAFTINRTKILRMGIIKEVAEGDGTAPTGGTDDTVGYSNFTPGKQIVEQIAFEPAAGTFTKPVAGVTAGVQLGQLDLETLLMPSGSAGVSAVNGYASIAALLMAAGNKETIVAVTSLTYAPATIAQLTTFSAVSPRSGSASAYIEQDGLLKKYKNIWGNIVLLGRPGTGTVLQFSGQSLYVAPTVSTYASWALPTQRAKPFLNTALTIQRSGGAAYTPVLKDFRFDMGCGTERVTDCNQSTGIKQILFADRRPKVTVTIALDKDGSAAFTYAQLYSDWVASTPIRVVSTLGTAGAAAGSLMTLNVPTAAVSATEGCIITNVTEGSDGGHRTAAIEMDVRSGTAEGDWSLALT